MSKFHEIEMKTITGQTKSFADFKGTRCLIVNVASR